MDSWGGFQKHFLSLVLPYCGIYDAISMAQVCRLWREAFKTHQQSSDWMRRERLCGNPLRRFNVIGNSLAGYHPGHKGAFMKMCMESMSAFESICRKMTQERVAFCVMMDNAIIGHPMAANDLNSVCYCLYITDDTGYRLHPRAFYFFCDTVGVFMTEECHVGSAMKSWKLVHISDMVKPYMEWVANANF